MPLFSYTARNKEGVLVTDALDAESEKSVIARLHADGLFPVKVTVAAQESTGTSAAGIRRGFPRRIKSRDIGLFTRQLSSLIDSGLPLTRALGVLAGQTQHEKLKNLIRELNSAVEGGASLAEALAKQPKHFSKLYVSMVRAGEASGALESVLLRLSVFFEKDEELMGRIKWALAYPALMLFVGTGTVVFLLSVVIPNFVELFKDLGQELPLPTRILIQGSELLKAYWLMILVFMLLSGGFLFKVFSSESGKHSLDGIKLRFPLLGQVNKKAVVSRFTRTFGTLLGNGVAVLSALEISRDVIGNRVLAQEVEAVHKSVSEGHGIAGPLRSSRVFPGLVIETIAIGEESGTLEKCLEKIADTYDAEVERAVKGMTALLEPLMILVLGLVVGFIVMAMLLPVFQADFLA